MHSQVRIPETGKNPALPDSASRAKFLSFSVQKSIHSAAPRCENTFLNGSKEYNSSGTYESPTTQGTLMQPQTKYSRSTSAERPRRESKLRADNEEVSSIRSVASSISQRIKSLFGRSGSKTRKDDAFLFDPEGPFSLTPYRPELLNRLDKLVTSEIIQTHLPFYPTVPLTLPDHVQFHKATGLLQHGLSLQEKGQHEAAIVNVLMAAELGVPLAMYWLAVSARYGWSRDSSAEESFSCFIFAAYLSLLACIQQDKKAQPTAKTHRRTATLMNSSIKDSIINMTQYSTAFGHKRSSTLTRGREKDFSAIQKSELLSGPSTIKGPGKSDFEPSPDFQLSLYDSQELAMILFEIGTCYEYGMGTKRNYEDAAYYYELSAGLGDPDAAQHIGDFYRHGRGVKRDKWRAAAYYRVAERLGTSLPNCTWIHKEKWGGSLPKKGKPGP